MARRKLFFFADHGDTAESNPVWTAYHFALVTHRAGLETELRLAAGAIDIFKRARTAAPGGRDKLAAAMNEAADSALPVSVSSGTDTLTKPMHEATERGMFISVCDCKPDRPILSDADLKRWGAVRRELSDVLTEVADGRSEPIYLG